MGEPEEEEETATMSYETTDEVDFYLKYMEWQNENSKSARNMIGRVIMESFINEQAISPIDVDDTIKEKIRKNYKDDCKKTIFDEAGEAVFDMMEGIYFPDFSSSPQYDEMMSGADDNGGLSGLDLGGGDFGDLTSALDALEEFG